MTDPNYLTPYIAPERNIHGQTIAMQNICHDLPILPEHHHLSHLQDKSGRTVAMLLAGTGQTIPLEWYHMPQLTDNHGTTVAMKCVIQGYPIPLNWKHDPSQTDCMGITVAMYLAFNSKPIPPEWQHNPWKTSPCTGMSVAMMIACKNIYPIPQSWHHYPDFQDSQGMTVAMHYVVNGHEVPKPYLHNPTIMNNDKKIVATLYTEYQAQHGLTITDIPNEWRTECMLCYQRDCSGYVKTQCNHVLCSECAKTYVENKCPMCRRNYFIVK